MPGRCVEKEAAAEGRRPLVVIGGYSAIADVDGDGKNEYVVGDYGIHVLKSDGSLVWEYAGNNLYAFALLDLDKEGKAEVDVPGIVKLAQIHHAERDMLMRWLAADKRFDRYRGDPRLKDLLRRMKLS